MREICHHCQRRCNYKSNGVPLCWKCGEDRQLRELYKIEMYGNYRSPVASCNLKQPAEPTKAWPGSEEKMKVMEERAARGEHIFHELDLTLLDDGV